MQKIFLPLLCTVLLCACSKKDEPPRVALDQKEITLNPGNTLQLTATLEHIGSEKAVWNTGDHYVATVSAQGMVTARYVGETEISLSAAGQRAVCKVTVAPTTRLYREPVNEFGSNKSAIKAAETRTLYDEVENGLLYEGENSAVIAVEYGFENNRLTGTIVYLQPSTASLVPPFLTERYPYLGQDGDWFVWENDRTAIGVTVDAGMIVVVYIPNTGWGKSLPADRFRDRLSSPLREADPDLLRQLTGLLP